MSTDVIEIGLVATVLERRNGIMGLQRYFFPKYFKHNGIVSFDTEEGRKHFSEHDIISISPHLYGTVGHQKLSRLYSFNIENKYEHTRTEEEIANESIAAEEEVSYGCADYSYLSDEFQ